MKLTSLAQNYGEYDRPSVVDEAYYPTIYLDSKQIEAMGLDAFKVMDNLSMMATVRICNKNEGKSGMSITLEILEAGVEASTKKPAAETILFPDDAKD